MKLDIAGRHLEVTEAMRSHVEEKAYKLKRHFDGLMTVHVTLSLIGGRNEAEFVVTAKRHQFVAKATDEKSMYAAIDAVIDKLDRQIIRFKDRLQEHRPDKKADAGAAAEARAEEASEAEQA